MEQESSQPPSLKEGGVEETARYMANQTALLFKYHDKGLKEKALEACTKVDALQFKYLDEEHIELAASGLVNALWEKDQVEFRYFRDGDLDTEGLRNADYGNVVQELRKRALVTGASPKYADKKSLAWRRHKSGGDYWTPYMEAQVYELRAALQNNSYPEKTRYGKSGPGPEPMRYVLASELHDMNTNEYIEQGIEVLIPYYSRILEGNTNEST